MKTRIFLLRCGKTALPAPERSKIDRTSRDRVAARALHQGTFRAAPMRAMRRGGFTIIELMIAVVIVGILAALAMSSYAKYSAKARAAEAPVVFAEIRTREEAYKFTTNVYLGEPSSNDGGTSNYGGVSSGGPMWPPPHSAQKAEAWNPTSPSVPTWWTNLGINPRKTNLYCSYVAIAGNGLTNTSFAGASSIALETFNNVATPPAEPWSYARARCDLANDITVATDFVTRYDSETVWVRNPGGAIGD